MIGPLCANQVLPLVFCGTVCEIGAYKFPRVIMYNRILSNENCGTTVISLFVDLDFDFNLVNYGV